MEPDRNQVQLSPLAARVLADHERAPEAVFYDLLTLGSFFDTSRIAQLDEAYQQLETLGLIERVGGRSVSFGGNLRPMYRLRANGPAESARRQSA